jgi:tRNA(fMet)-specific endonuclease VapC
MILFIDTSIFVDVLRNKVVRASKRLFESIMESSDEGLISSITVAELSVGAHLSPRPDAVEKTRGLLALVSIISLSEILAFHGGAIYSELVRDGFKIELNDCLIAATCLSAGSRELVTRNLDHFERIEELRACTPEDLGF